MKRAARVFPSARRHGCPNGFTYRGLLFALPALLVVPLIAWFGLPRLSASPDGTGPMTYVVQRGTFVHDVTEHGDVESASNVEIRCEVESHGAGTMILWIIPEGTYVEPVPDWKPQSPGEEPPDLLVKLDSSSLEKELIKQQIVCNSSAAAVTQARNNYETAVIAKEEYLKGTYEKEKQKFQAEIVLAEQRRTRAKEYLEYSKQLHAKGYIPDRELEANQFDVQRRELDLAVARTSLKVLDDYTKRKQLLQLEADIDTAKAKLKAEEHSHQLDLEELARIEDQVAKCTIRAPQAGQVVYANVTDRRGGQEIIIEEGTMVRERQEIIRLPDSKNMQVKAKINEARVALVREGMPATIELDAFPDLKLKGSVQKVNEYPEPASWFSGNVKEYTTIVKIHDFPAELQMRPGMTAKVSIRVEQLNDVLTVPVQAVLEHGGKHYCAIRNGDQWEARPVVIGATNDKEVVIREGLQPGEQVVLGPGLYRDKLNLPELPKESETLAPSDVAAELPGGAADTGPGGSPAAAPKGDLRPPGRGPEGRPGGPPMAGGLDPSQRFKSMDANGDGKLDASEMPEPMKARLSALDTNGDGAVDLGELSAGSQMMGRMREGGGPGGPGAGSGGGPPGGPGDAGGGGVRERGLGRQPGLGKPPGAEGRSAQGEGRPKGPGGGSASEGRPKGAPGGQGARP